jgi:hypothetical protein
MQTKIWLLFSILISPFITSCQKEFIGIESAEKPTSVFNQIWKDFDENYGLYEVKNIDWDSVYQALSPEVDDQMTPSQLYQSVVSMLSILNDKHVTLFPASNPELPRWSIDLDQDGVFHNEVFDFDVVKENYLSDLHEPAAFAHYGWINSKTGYLHLQHMDASRKSYEKVLDEALAFFVDAEELILDLRDCSGGYDPNSQYVAGRFCNEPQLYMTTRKKNGPGHDDFAETQHYHVEPTGKRQFNRPVIFLTSSMTASAGETLTLALNTQNHIRQMGGTTAGNFSDNPMWEASNGWSYTISVGDYRDARGKSFEGIGIKPDVEINSSRAALQEGRDLMLEKAIELF